MRTIEKKDSGQFRGEQGFAVPLELKNLDNEAEGTFEGYASLFDGRPDRGNDIVMKGAFAATLLNRKPISVKLLYQHQADQLLGKIIDLREDDTGLYIKAALNMKVPKAVEVHALMQDGVMDSMSIGYRTVRSEYDDKTDVRRLIELELWEVSLVTFPMKEGALVTRMKSADATEKDVENRLRDVAGFSRRQAKALMSGGFHAFKGLRDAGQESDSDSLAEALASARSAFSN